MRVLFIANAVRALTQCEYGSEMGLVCLPTQFEIRINRNAVTSDCTEIFDSSDKYKIELATDQGSCPIGNEARIADRHETISYMAECIEYKDSQFQGKVYIRKVTSTGDIDVASGILIACRPADFSISTEINIEDKPLAL